MLATVSLSQAQTKLTYTLTVSKDNIENNHAIISNDFAPQQRREAAILGKNTVQDITTVYD